ncbi:MAG: hypothetical protein ABI776_16170 [Nocardioidaceae bacterium]
MRTTLRVTRALLDIVARTGGLLLVSWAFTWGYEKVSPEPIGVDFGEAFLVFGLLLAASGLWAAWDAFHRGLVVVALVWVATGLLTSVGMAALSSTSSGSLRGMLEHLGGVDSFWAGLVIVPALLAAGLVAVVRATTAPLGPQPDPRVRG